MRKKERQYDEDGLVIRTNKEAEKRLRESIKAFAKELLKLPNEKYADLPINATLIAALKEAKRLENNAFRRHLSFVVRLIHEQDFEAIQAAYTRVHHPYRNDPAKIREIEQLRDQLIADDKQAFEHLLNHYDGVDVQHVRQLARNARKEQEKAEAAVKTATETGQPLVKVPQKNMKLLYQYLFKLPLKL